MILPNYSLNLLGKKIAFSAFVQVIGRIFQIILGAISLKLISNFLTQEGYGIYASIAEYTLFFSTVANLGIFGNVVRLMADKPNDSKIFFHALFVRATTGIFFFALAILICVLNGSSEIFIIGTALFCSALLFDFLTSVCDGMLQANYLMGRATAALLLGKIFQVAMLFWIIENVGSLEHFWILGATLLGSLITFLISIFLVSRRIKIFWKLEWGMMLIFFKKSLPFGIISLINTLYFRFIPDYLASNLLSNAHFGSFNISFRISQVLSLASTFIMFSALPGLTRYIDGKDYDKAKKLFFSLQKIFLVAGLTLIIIGSLIGPYAISILTHSKYNIPELSFILPMMLILAAISYGYDLVLLSLFAAGKDIWFMWREFIALGVSMIFFVASYFPVSMTDKMILIFLGAIAGESLMVILSTIKVRKFFSTQSPDPARP